MPASNPYIPSPYITKNMTDTLVGFLRSPDDEKHAIDRLKRKDYTGCLRVPVNATFPIYFTGTYVYSSAAILPAHEFIVQRQIEHYPITRKIMLLPTHSPGYYRISNINGSAIELIAFPYQEFLYGPAIGKDDMKYDAYLEYKSLVNEAWTNVNQANKMPKLRKRRIPKTPKEPTRKRQKKEKKEKPKPKPKKERKPRAKSVKSVRQKRQVKSRL